MERQDGSVKNIRYGRARACEQKEREQIVQKHRPEAKRTDAVSRYRVVEDENSIFEYDLNCLYESEAKRVEGKRIEK